MLRFNPPVVGHRGACAYAPENTMSAFMKAQQLGIQWVEFDVMQASSGELVIFHDDTLERTSNGRGVLSEHSYLDLSSLDAGSWFNLSFFGERIPTLNMVINFLDHKNMSANIEIKALAGHEEKLVKQVLKEMQPYLDKANERFLFSSFSMDALRVLREQSKTCQIGLLLHEWEPTWKAVCEELQCVSVHVNQEIMTETAAQIIKGMDKTLLCYTVNDVERANELYAWGVDAVFSDAPDVIVNGLKLGQSRVVPKK